jgi:anti-sigma regulatory factor (Ser/Thr protein kinase)
MIEQPLGIAALRRVRAPSQSILIDLAQFCIDAGLDLCAVYRVDPSSPPLSFASSVRIPVALTAGGAKQQETIHAMETLGYTVERFPIIVAGAIRGTVLFACYPGTSLSAAFLESASVLFTSAIAQSDALAHHERVSNRLQRVLLPAKLPHIEGVRFDAAYNPASREAEVGGDWYDTFEIGNGCVGISVGDVTGHGLEAAVTMSEIRHAIRAAASVQTLPTLLLNAVDSTIAQQDIGIASAVVGILDPKTAILRYSSAGHPAPIFVTARGRAYALPGGGTLLGLGLEDASPGRTVTLTPGSACIFYTDGLTENDRDPIIGEENLISAIERLASDGPLMAEAIQDLVFADEQRDDCAILIVSCENWTSDRELYTFSSVPSSGRLFRDAVRDFTERAGMDADEQFDVVVAVGEAIANAIEHGEQDSHGSVAMELLLLPDSIVVNVESRGHWKTVSSEDRGRGISLMRAHASDLQIISTSQRTRVSLIFERA